MEELDVSYVSETLLVCTLTMLQQICQAEWVHYQAGRVKVWGERRRARRGLESINKDAFGPHYVASQLLWRWLPGWDLRDEAHKRLCVRWVKEDRCPVRIPRPASQLLDPGASWEIEEVAAGAVPANPEQSHGWDNSENPEWRPDSGRVRVEAKDHNGRVLNGQYLFV